MALKHVALMLIRKGHLPRWAIGHHSKSVGDANFLGYLGMIMPLLGVPQKGLSLPYWNIRRGPSFSNPREARGEWKFSVSFLLSQWVFRLVFCERQRLFAANASFLKKCSHLK